MFQPSPLKQTWTYSKLRNNDKVYSVNVLIIFNLKCPSNVSLNGLNNAGKKNNH